MFFNLGSGRVRVLLRIIESGQVPGTRQALPRLATGSPEIPLHFRVIGMGVQPTVVSETLYSFSRDFGQRGTYIEVSFCCCSVFPTAQAISGIDVALWDLLGHLLKVPVCHLLGGSFRSIDVKAPNI